MVDETESGQVFLGVSPVFPCQKFHLTIFSTFKSFVSFHFFSYALIMVYQLWSVGILVIHVTSIRDFIAFHLWANLLNKIFIIKLISTEYKSEYIFILSQTGGDSMVQAISRSPPTTRVPGSHFGHSMWVSWWTKRNPCRFSFGISPVFLYHKFHSIISPHSCHSFRLISFHPPL